MNNKNIDKVMKELVKHFDFKDRTTLNRMRKKPDAFKILISCLLSLRARDEATEVVSDNLFAVVRKLWPLGSGGWQRISSPRA